VTLIEDGEPRARIVVASDAPGSVLYAASELRDYLRKLSGAALRIERVGPGETPGGRPGEACVFVGESSEAAARGLDAAGLAPDGFRIVVDGSSVALIGRDYRGPPMEGFRHPLTPAESYSAELGLSAFGEAGSLHAVHHFLETLGVRWLMPGELGEVVPETATIAVKETAIERAPAFEYRYAYFCNFGKPEHEDRARWYRRAGFGARRVVNINHSFYLLKKCWETHPEYFGLIDGKRDHDATCQGHGSLCLSEEGLLRQIVTDVRAYFDANPQVSMFPVMPNDSYMRICECARCRGKDDASMGAEGKFSDYVWGFVNRVAEEVYKTHPDRFVACCSYGHYQSPPKALARLSPNVAVMKCKRRRDHWDKAYQARMNEFLAAWASKASAVYIWEYYNWHDRAHKYYSRLYDWGYSLFGAPIFFTHSVQEDLRFLRGIGVKGEFIEVDAPRCPGLVYPILYLTGKLLWDPDADVARIMDDYCRNAYGPAAAEMQRFFTRAEQVWMRPESRKELYTRRDLVNAFLDDLWRAWRKCDGAHRRRIELLLGEVNSAAESLKGAWLAPPPGKEIALVAESQDAAPGGARWRTAEPIPAEPERKYHLSGRYVAASAGAGFVRFHRGAEVILASRFFLPAAPTEQDLNRTFVSPPETDRLALEFRLKDERATMTWRQALLAQGEEVAAAAGAARPAPAPGAETAVAEGEVRKVRAPELTLRGGAVAQEGVVVLKPAPGTSVQWRFFKERRRIIEEFLPGFHYALTARVRTRRLDPKQESAFGYWVRDRLNRAVVPATVVPATLCADGEWVTLRLASFVPDGDQVVSVNPTAGTELHLDSLALAPDPDARDEMRLRELAAAGDRYVFCLRIRKNGFAGLKLLDAPDALSVAVLARANWRRRPEAFGGLILDYGREAGPERRVFVGMGLLGARAGDDPSVPFPEIRPHALIETPGRADGLLRDCVTDLKKHAPPDWNRELWLYFALMNTGDESMMTAVLREPARETLKVVGRRVNCGDCYYALVK